MTEEIDKAAVGQALQRYLNEAVDARDRKRREQEVEAFLAAPGSEASGRLLVKLGLRAKRSLLSRLAAFAGAKAEADRQARKEEEDLESEPLLGAEHYEMDRQSGWDDLCAGKVDREDVNDYKTWEEVKEAIANTPPGARRD